jgi:hypothetical protein
MRPEEILPDDVNEVSLDGVRVRKGSVAAFLANARIVVDAASTDEARRTAEAHIADLVPSLVALHLFDVFDVRDPRIRALVERYR